MTAVNKNSEEELKNYIDVNLRNIMEPLVDALISETPEDPVHYIIMHFKKLKGINIEQNTEKIELNNLRKEILHYKKVHGTYEDEEMKVESYPNSEGEDEVEKVDELIEKKIKVGMPQRASVSAEVYGLFNKKQEFVPKVIKKSNDQLKRILHKVSQSFLFNSLEEGDLNKVIDAMEEVKFNQGDFVIKQGDNGDCLYLVDSGELECFKLFKKEDGEIKVKEYFSGDAFGELALLYNAPRAATIKSKGESVLFKLDRETFNNIVKDSAIKKREKYVNFLKKIEILSTVDDYELSQIADALTVQKFKKDEYIIKQNEVGDNFFIIEEGEAIATKSFNQGEAPQKVLNYSEGGYFGELAIIRNEPRAANVVAITDCKLLSLERKSFKRLLGPIEEILKRNSDQYLKYVKK